MPRKQKTGVGLTDELGVGQPTPAPDKVKHEREPAPPEETRADEEFFRGGMPLDLTRRMKNGKTLRENLEADIVKELRNEIDNHKARVEKINKWEKMYRGEKPQKVIPYIGAANLATPLTRIRTEGAMVRVFDALFGQQKFWVCKPRDAKSMDVVRQIEDGLDWWAKGIAYLRQKLISPLSQAMQTGTGFLYVPYVRRKRTVYGYAGNEADVANSLAPGTMPPGGVKSVKIKTASGTEPGVKKTLTVYDGPDAVPIDRKDVVWSSDATNLQEAHLVAFRTYLYKSQVQSRVNQGYYLEDALQRIRPDEFDETKKRRAKEKGLDIKSEEKEPYAIWQAWVKYDVDEDGEEDDVVLSIHEKSATVCRGMYNEFFSGFRPLVPLVFYPLPYCVDGEGMCEILEHLQEEKDTVHNQRLDRMNQINAPITIIRSSAGVNQFERQPGMVWEVNDDPTTVAYELPQRDAYPSTWQEEALIDQMADQASGVGPIAMGQPTTERPVAKDTMILREEMNKKFKFGIDNLRSAFGELGYIVVEELAQFQPHYTYYTEGAGAGGAMQEQMLAFPFTQVRDAVKIELAASSELLDVATRREVGLTLFQLAERWNTGLVAVGQGLANPQMPPPLKDFMIQLSVQSATLLRDIFRDFNRVDADKLVLDLSSLTALAQAPPPPPMLPPGQGAEAPPPGAMGESIPPGAMQGPPPSFGGGGIAMTPQVARIGEKEPEIVMPVSRFKKVLDAYEHQGKVKATVEKHRPR